MRQLEQGFCTDERSRVDAEALLRSVPDPVILLDRMPQIDLLVAEYP